MLSSPLVPESDFTSSCFTSIFSLTPSQHLDFLFITFSLAEMFLRTLLMEETLGIVSVLQMPSLISLSLVVSQDNTELDSLK